MTDARARDSENTSSAGEPAPHVRAPTSSVTPGMPKTLLAVCNGVSAHIDLPDQTPLAASCTSTRRWYNEEPRCAHLFVESLEHIVDLPPPITSLCIHGTNERMTHTRGMYLLAITPSTHLRRIEVHLEKTYPQCLRAWCWLLEKKMGILKWLHPTKGHVHVEVRKIYTHPHGITTRELSCWAVPLHRVFNQHTNITIVICGKNIDKEMIRAYVRQNELEDGEGMGRVRGHCV